MAGLGPLDIEGKPRCWHNAGSSKHAIDCFQSLLRLSKEIQDGMLLVLAQLARLTGVIALNEGCSARYCTPVIADCGVVWLKAIRGSGSSRSLDPGGAGRCSDAAARQHRFALPPTAKAL